MNKRILSLALVLLMCFSVLTLPAAADTAPTVSASYSSGMVAVSGSNYTANASYIVRIVNHSTNVLAAMTQVEAGTDGSISASVTTGALATLTNYTVYVNSLDGVKAAETQSISGTPATAYTITASAGTGGSISPSGSVSVTAGSSKTFTITANSGYSISTVTVDGSSVGAKSTYIFSNVTANHTIAATFAYKSSSSGSDDNDSSSTSTSTSTSGDTTTASTTVSSSTSSAGVTAATVSASTVSSLVTQAKAAESKGKSAVVEINVRTGTATKSAELTIPGNALKQITKSTDAALEISAGVATVTLSADAVESIASTAGSTDVTISMDQVNASTLPSAVQRLVGDRPVFDFSVKTGSSKISSFGGGSAAVSIPYTLQANEDANAIVVYYVDSTGALQTVRGAYNSETRAVDFVTSHFSEYAVAYHPVSFTDVGSDVWCNAAVTFCAARSITTGATATTFNPNAAVTRGQFLVMLMRAYDLAPSTNPSDNFADAGNTYYTNYLARAKELGITAGTGNNLFAPNNKITRQQMFTLLYRALDKLGEVPEATTSKTLSSFSDAATVSNYAKEAMTALVRGGIVSGSYGKLNPQGQTTRGQMAQVLYNLLSK